MSRADSYFTLKLRKIEAYLMKFSKNCLFFEGLIFFWTDIYMRGYIITPQTLQTVPGCGSGWHLYFKAILHKAGYTHSHFASVFHRTHHKIRNTHYTLSHFMRILRFINVAKKEKWNPLTFCVNADPKKGCAKRESGTTYPTIHFSFFAFCPHFRVFCDKCIAGLTGNNKPEIMNTL